MRCVAAVLMLMACLVGCSGAEYGLEVRPALTFASAETAAGWTVTAGMFTPTEDGTVMAGKNLLTVGQADLYLMCGILHDYSQADVDALLEAIVRIRSSSKVYLALSVLTRFADTHTISAYSSGVGMTF